VCEIELGLRLEYASDAAVMQRKEDRKTLPRWARVNWLGFVLGLGAGTLAIMAVTLYGPTHKPTRSIIGVFAGVMAANIVEILIRAARQRSGEGDRDRPA
jgi:uncharacterized membrane protein